MIQLYTDYRSRGGEFFCCSGGDLVPVPAAMADGSAEVGALRDFRGGDPVLVQDDIGIPVFSTWGGYRARDH